jgi:hypothetical protein
MPGERGNGSAPSGMQCGKAEEPSDHGKAWDEGDQRRFEQYQAIAFARRAADGESRLKKGPAWPERRVGFRGRASVGRGGYRLRRDGGISKFGIPPASIGGVRDKPGLPATKTCRWGPELSPQRPRPVVGGPNYAVDSAVDERSDPKEDVISIRTASQGDSKQVHPAKPTLPQGLKPV